MSLHKRAWLSFGGSFTGRSRKGIRRHRSLGVQELEDRRLLSGVPSLVADINNVPTPSASGTPLNLVAIDDMLYFTADDGVNGRELWRSDGTAEGTVLVKDIRPGSNSAAPFNLTAIGDTLYFTANDGRTGHELWKSDGTADGTVLVKDIWSVSNSASPFSLTVVGDTLYFTANDYATGHELWKSDGTADGTVLVKDIWPGSNSAAPDHLTVVGDTLYFTANGGVRGHELWKSDGTAEGTVLVKYILSFSGSADPDHLTVVGDTLYFTANGGATGHELWKSDGTADGTVLVKDIWPGRNPAAPPSLNPSNLTALGNTLYFRATNGVNGVELWKSDGTADGTVLVKDIGYGSNSAAPFNLTAIGDTLYFTANDGRTGHELWKSDGTADGTVLVMDIRPGSDLVAPANLTAVGSRLYFTTDDGFHGRELWVLDAVLASGVVDVPEGQTVIDPTAHTDDERVVKRGLGTLILDQTNSHSGGTVVESGELIIRNPLALGTGTLQVAAGAKVTLDVGTRQVPVARLELSPTGVLDLATGSVVLPSGTYDQATIRGLITSARGTGAWSGPGITSSSIQPGSFREIGFQVLPDGSLKVGYSAVGDANMDGTVSVQDLIALNASGKYGTAATDAGWWQGDFNYDNRVNVTDLISLVSSGLYGAGSYLPIASAGASDLQTTGAAEPVLSVVPTGVTLTGYAAPENQPEPILTEATAAPATRAPEARRVDEFAWAAIASQPEPAGLKDRKVSRWRMVGR